MKVLYLTSEARPFAATGGLGDVASSLPPALRDRVVGCRVVMPLYQSVPTELRGTMKYLGSVIVPVAWRQQYCGIFEANWRGTIYYLLDNEYYFRRPGLYGDYDDAERFAFLSRAALEILPAIDFHPDILHANDWQTALLPVYYRLLYADLEGYEGIKTVFTIHNIEYQGKYGTDILEDVLGLPKDSLPLLEHDGCLNLMKAALCTADRITTVSPTYAEELRDPWFAHGLENVIRARQDTFTGILNGIDTTQWDPETDPYLAAPYTPEDLSGKAEDKRALQELLGLPQEVDTPLIGIVSRLVEQKGIDLIACKLEELLQEQVQLAVLGSGDRKYEELFAAMQQKYPEKCAFTSGFRTELSHKIYAGSDLLLMPSKMEPCGLAQMIACRYGTLPIVRETGGLRDSIVDCGDEGGFGFTFQTYNADDMLQAVRRGLGAYANKKDWEVLTGRAMQRDFSWGSSARRLIALYRTLLKES